jgi:hypothetical protein
MVSDMTSRMVYVPKGREIVVMTQQEFQKEMDKTEMERRLMQTKISFFWLGDRFTVPMKLVPDYLVKIARDGKEPTLVAELSLKYAEKIVSIRSELSGQK